MIDFHVYIEEDKEGHVRINLKSESSGQFCSKGELQTFKKFYEFLNKDFYKVGGGDIRSTKTGKG